MTGLKTNERPGIRAQVRNVRMSASKARVVLDLIRNQPVDEAEAVLTYTERAAAEVVSKVLASAVANAANNENIDPETLYVTACYADEGRTLYRFRPRARGRATRIRKRSCHITVIVAPMPADLLARVQAKREAVPGSRAARRRGQEAADRAARVAASQEVDDEVDDLDEDAADITDEALETDADVEVDETEVDATEADAVEDVDVEIEADEAEADAEASEAPEPVAEAPDADDAGDDEADDADEETK